MMAADNGHDLAQKPEDGSLFADSFNRMNMNDNVGGPGEYRLGPEGEPAPRTDEEYAQTQLTLRAIVSSKEAGVIIGKGGKNVADLRNETGVKAGVSKVIQGIQDRVLTMTGSLESIAKAYAIVAKGLLEGAPTVGMGGVIASNGTHRKSRVPLGALLTIGSPLFFVSYCDMKRLVLPGAGFMSPTPCPLAFVDVFVLSQRSVFSSPITRWGPSSADKASRSSIYRMSQGFGW